jgi:hypothetical protein
VEQVLAPRLEPGHVVILDNLSAHKVAGVRQLIEDRGAQLRTAALALLSRADGRIIARYLKRAAASKTADSKRRKEGPNSVGTSFSTGRTTELYRLMHAIHVSERLTTEAKVLRRFATSIAQRSLSWL